MIAVLRKVTDYGDTRGLDLSPGEAYKCVDCGKTVKVATEWPPPPHSRSVLYTWKLASGAVVSICKKDWEKRNGAYTRGVL